MITTVRGRAAHLARQRRVLAAGPPVHHVVVGMGEAPDLAPGGPTTTVAVIPAPGPLPLAAARNAGARIALDHGAQLLIFLDVDCLPGPGLVEGYRRAAARRGDALLAGPVTFLPAPGPDGVPEHDLHAHVDPHPGRPVPADGELRDEPRRELFWSLSFAVTATTWAGSGGFDEGYRGYGAEDTDFALSCGLPLLWVGGAHALHQYHPPARTDPARVREIVDNAGRFHAAWGWWPMEPWLRELHATGHVVFDERGLRAAAPPG